MQVVDPLETDRLVLRRPRAADADAIFERYASDPNVTRYVGWPRQQSADESRAFVRFSDDEWRRWGCGPYLIWPRAGGRLLGGTGLSFDTPRRAATGYVLARDVWGRGYATEALAAMVDLARRLGVADLYAVCHAEHRVSAHVLEKCGFTLTRTLESQTFPNLSPALGPALHYARVP
jgi:RimJ/RimL family protein N-acetyltransferase